jgi:hypothetical protein
VRRAYKILVGKKPKGNTPLGRPRRRLADNIREKITDIFLGYGLD